MPKPQLSLRADLLEAPIIPAIRRPEHLDAALRAHGRIIYFLVGDPENCEPMMQRVLAAGKLPIVNLDLFSGFSRDKHAVNYLKKCGAQGIISTHLEPLRHARSIDLFAIQRTFLIDSGAVESVSAQLKNSPVDALEVLPAMVAPKIVARVRGINAEIAVVGGGLIDSLKEVEELLAQGLDGISISKPEMWLR